jgi:hypothetical protein
MKIDLRLVNACSTGHRPVGINGIRTRMPRWFDVVPSLGDAFSDMWLRRLRRMEAVSYRNVLGIIGHAVARKVLLKRVERKYDPY